MNNADTMIHLTTLNRTKTQRRFYHIEIIIGLFGQWGVQQEWGKTGQNGQLRIDWYDARDQAEAEATRLANIQVEAWYRESEMPSRQLKRRKPQPSLTQANPAEGGAYPILLIPALKKL